MKNNKKILQKIADKKHRRNMQSKMKHRYPRDPGYRGGSVPDEIVKTKPIKTKKPKEKKNLWGAIKQAFRRKII